LISSLSTFIVFGAKLISLYLFRAKIGGKVCDKPVFYAFYSHISGYCRYCFQVMHAFSTSYAHVIHNFFVPL